MEQYNIKFLTRALRDLEGIYAYIAGHFQEPGTAEAMLDELEQGVFSLEQMPNRCPERKWGAYAGKGYRQLLVKNYTVVYRVEESTRDVVIVAVRYSRSQF